METEILKYKLTGSMACWQFTENSKNYPGWNICIDAEARTSLINLIDKMTLSEWPSKKTISLSNPLDLKNDWIKNVGNYKVAQSLIISNRKEPSDLWKLSANKSELTISIGSVKLNELREGISNQIFDEAISGNQNSDSDILYFW